MLGGDYDVIQNAWTWVVDSNKTANYFSPHRDLGVDGDFIDEKGMPTLLSVWIPLTDVTTRSSCMYVLPASRDPEYPHEALHWRKKYDSEGHRPWKTNDLVNIRALPANRGSFLAWNAGVFHWGSEPHRKAPPRISIGYYFHASHAKKKYPDLIDLKKPFSCQDRLGVILKSIQLYGKSLKNY
jgi:ectoine hydroxylase-related dioxygenase (phytanoyl-CoA dioxygenase family)